MCQPTDRQANSEEVFQMWYDDGDVVQVANTHMELKGLNKTWSGSGVDLFWDPMGDRKNWGATLVVIFLEWRTVKSGVWNGRKVDSEYDFQQLTEVVYFLD